MHKTMAPVSWLSQLKMTQGILMSQARNYLRRRSAPARQTTQQPAALV
jgi:transcription initiation factor IIF auxiliary subunit